MATTVRHPRRDKSGHGHLTAEIATSAAGEVGPLLLIHQGDDLLTIPPVVPDAPFSVHNSVTSTGYIDKPHFEAYMRTFVDFLNSKRLQISQVGSYTFNMN